MITALRHLRGPATGQRRLAIVDIAAFVILAIGIGTAVGLALMGSVILLSGDARGETLAVPVLDTEVEIRVAGPIVRARVRQAFRHPFDDWQEGIYVFPLPEDAAVDHLKMRVSERVVEGEIKERPNIFTTSVANIAPRSQIVVEIEYQQNLRFDNGIYRLRFPMVVTPRYLPGRSDGTAGHGWAENTEQVPDASRITPTSATRKFNSPTAQTEGKLRPNDSTSFNSVNDALFPDGVPAGVEAWPKRLPDLYLGAPLMVSAALPRRRQIA